MPVTLQDVALASGYSVPTVSRVLTGSSHPVSSKSRQKILETAKALGYRPNLAARGLRTERTGAVGVLVHDIASPFAAQLVRGIQDALTPHNYICLLVNSDRNPAMEEQAIDGLLQRPVDGIIFAEYLQLARYERIENMGKPCIFVYRLFASQVPNSVAPDDHGGACLATQHLIDLGHKKIGYISGPTDWDASHMRMSGWRDAMLENGLEVCEEWIGYSNWEVEGGYAAMQKILSAKERPTAIFAANDFNAAGAIYAAQDAGLRVPQDMAVVGYDNREIALYMRPKITTVELPLYEMGKIAAETLFRQINGEDPLEHEIMVRGQIHVRESCGAPPEQRTVEFR